MKKIFIYIQLCLAFANTYAQQWSGSTSTTGTIIRNGNVVIQNEGSGLIIDADNEQRVGFMKYPGKYAGLWRNPNSPFEIGRVTGSITSPTAYSTDLFISENGNVGIGNTTPGTFKLAVEGKIGAREIKVTLTNPWPDYVFHKKYTLPSLASLEQYIAQHNHLPGIPSAKEVQENGGIDLGQMNAKLLEKIEELTLYLIELKKENQEIKKQLRKVAAK
jgi:hypothetical protein